MASKSDVEIDMVNRDPNDLNPNLQVMFEDVIGEPVGAHSIDCVWTLTHKCFNGSKACCYKTLTVLCAAPLALMWGCEFAMITFYHIWTVAPCLRSLSICTIFWKSSFITILECCCYPICEGYGLMLSKIRVEQVTK